MANNNHKLSQDSAHMFNTLDIMADIFLAGASEPTPPSEDFLDMAEDEGQSRLDYQEWEGHLLERNEWDSARSAATPDDWESTTPYMHIIPEEKDHHGGGLPPFMV